ncbi:ABC transporter substrate-binding protein [Advenella mimigardefordensis]|uniref:Periplasmic dipeptide transport protein n=1 Tax=Advenella mimigardefordensis (strain DSM 17166 / LMG 22922 / DPN7) TaxID=1247726 RepID=W0PIG4_ADVMD|nr:ABC transporter substrate-binding protein [Advenella mimigardefordensis]AHG64713.1 periplasmic dipeptide transport protein [Advenella mimigardefordensis DPN7]
MKGNTTRIILSALFAGIAGAAQAAGTLIYCSEGSPAGFDTPQYTSGTDFDASARSIYNGLVSFRRGSTEVIPELAEKWDISENGLEYTFHLRRGVKFHTTRFFTPTRELIADDVVYTFERMMDKNHPFRKAYPAEFPYFTDMGMDKNLKSVQKIDDYTVKFTLNEVDAPFLQNMAMAFAVIFSKEYMEKLLNEGKPQLLNQQPLGTGPFVFDRYQKDAQIRYRANTAYWDKEEGPLVDNLIFAITKDPTVRAQKLRSGECHIASHPLPADVERLKKESNLKVLSSPGFNVGFIYYNTEKTPLQKPEVRMALDMAINKPAIIKAVYGGQGVLAEGPMPTTQWSYDDTLKGRSYDVGKAKALLKEAGYPDGFEMGLWSLPVARPYNPNGRLMAELIQADWAKIGVRVSISTYEWGEYLRRAQKGEHDVIMAGWTGDNGDPDNWLGNLLSCGAVGGSNYSRFCYRPFDDLVVRARRETDQQGRTQLYKEAQKIFHEQMPMSPIGTSIVNVPMNKKVQGFKISPFGMFQFNGVSMQ